MFLKKILLKSNNFTCAYLHVLHFVPIALECGALGFCCCAAVRAVTVMMLMRARKRRACDAAAAAAAVSCCHFISGSSRKYHEPRCNEPTDRITCRAAPRTPRFHLLKRLEERCCTGGPANALHVYWLVISVSNNRSFASGGGHF